MGIQASYWNSYLQDDVLGYSPAAKSREREKGDAHFCAAGGKNEQGAWSGEAKDVLMCAFKQKQIVALKRAVKETDPSAFLIVCDAHEVLGQGFHSYHQHDL